MDNQNIEYKVKSIRADDDTYEKFKAIASQEFGNQGQCLATLINLYEMEQGKTKLIERKIEIDHFQMHLNKMGELFVMSLQLNQDAEERIHSEFEKLLESKDRVIIDLQAKVDQLKKQTEDQDSTLEMTKIENLDYFKEIVELKKKAEKENEEHARAMIDKDNLNKALTDSCNERKAEIEKLQKDVEFYKLQAEAFLSMKKKADDFEEENQKLKNILESLKKEYVAEFASLKESAELDKERAIIALEKIQQKELKELNKQHNAEIRDYVSKLDHMREVQDQTHIQLIERIKGLDDQKNSN